VLLGCVRRSVCGEFNEFSFLFFNVVKYEQIESDTWTVASDDAKPASVAM
jgi:hypothetical protein